MRQITRLLGVAALAVSLMNASAGLCFCHHGPVLPGAPASAQGCCHGPDSSGQTAVKSTSFCCHIESAESSAAPAATIQMAPPAAVFTPFSLAASALESLPLVTAALPSSSPPIFALRI
jgi:hypothetical protein